jgi:hypothetical protein
MENACFAIALLLTYQKISPSRKIMRQQLFKSGMI